MNMHFNCAHHCAPQMPCSPEKEDIVVRLDSAGFVVNASENAARLGVDLDCLLVMPHITDFADTQHRADVARYVEEVLAGGRVSETIEFSASVCEIEEGTFERCSPDDPRYADGCSQWYALELRLVTDGNQRSLGALGVLQSVQHKYTAASKEALASGSDPVTGLANRRSLVRRLTRSVATGEPACHATFAIDGMRAIYMQYGQDTADEIRWGFARFLETMTEPQQELAQLDDERFGVVLPGLSPRAAREWASDVLRVFSGLAMKSMRRAPELSASAGLARVETSADWTLRQAELGLVMARAGGGMQAAICQHATALSSGMNVERAMEAAVQRAVRRYS